MKKIKVVSLMTLLLAIIFGGALTTAQADTTPSLGSALTYAALSSTYTNTAAGTTITGDIGYTTGPAVAAAGVHTNVGSGAPYAAAGTSQGATLVSLNSQVCTFTFANGAIDLATDTTHGTQGVYPAGVYCITGAASIGTAGITLTGSGTHIFRMTGALTSVANSVVSLSGTSACDVWWTPGAATTLGADSTFIGNDVDAAGITLNNHVTWNGRALAYGGTVTTVSNDTISAPTCGVSTATLTVVKTVINNSGGSQSVLNFPLFVNSTSVLSGAGTTFAPGTYTVTETNTAGYTASVWGGDCSAAGSVTLFNGDIKVCTITNDDNAVVVPPSSGGSSLPSAPRVAPIISITKIPSPLALSNGSGLVTYAYTVSNPGTVSMRNIKVTDDKCLNVTFVSGDTNNNAWLETNETWKYTCASQLTQTTKNIANVIGYDAGGMPATAVTNATVVVSQPVIYTPVIISTPTPTTTSAVTKTPIVPKLPNTGLSELNSSWYLIALIGVLSSLSLLYAVSKKQSN